MKITVNSIWVFCLISNFLGIVSLYNMEKVEKKLDSVDSTLQIRSKLDSLYLDHLSRCTFKERKIFNLTKN
jgi:hypothetical protein